MLNLITGPKGSGKTKIMIDLANEIVKKSQGNVVLIKKSQKGTVKADFRVRVISMDEYKEILTFEEFVGFIYGMVAGNHDIETIFIDGVLKQANINLDNLSDFLHKLNKISAEHNIEFYTSISTDVSNIPKVDDFEYKIIA